MTNTGYSLISRRGATILCAGLGAGLFAPKILPPAWAQSASPESPLLARPIPHSSEMLPVVGLGTINLYDTTDPAARAACTSTVRTMVAHGGTLIDTSQSYGASEATLGGIFAETGLRDRVFIATKTDLKDYNPTDGPAAMKGSLQRLKTNKIDLMQFHNVSDPNQDLSMLRDWKAQGLCRYVGITTTSAASYDAAVAIIGREKPDFLMVDYAIDKRESENKVLPAAADAGTAVIIALPFGRTRLFASVMNKNLPDWAADIDCTSWAQFLLKFVLGNPAVTAVVPGTNNPAHMIDDLDAGRGRMPNEKQRAQMVQYVESLG